MWGKRAVNGRWFECPHGAVRKDGHQRRPYGFIMKDGSPMPRCKRPECVERMRIMSKETVMIPTSEHFHNTSTRGDGLKEINKVQIQRRIIKRRGTEMMSCEQLENSEGGHLVQEAKENNWERIIRFFYSQRAYQDTLKQMYYMANKHMQRRTTQHDDFQKEEIQRPKQQDESQKEILMAAERLQTSDNRLKQHRKAREEVLGDLPETTTQDDFQKLIRAEKDRQHMHKQDGNWQAVEECIKETQSLASRQKHLGELEQRECEEYLECEQQIRSINHMMNVAEVNTVQSVQEQKGIEKQKQALTIQKEAWKSLMDMRNSLKEPEKVDPVGRNKMETKQEVKPPQDQFVEELDKMPGNDAQAYDRQLRFEQDHQRRLAELDIEERKQAILTKQRQEAEQSVANRLKIYERMLQLGNHEVAAELLLEITRDIATEKNRSANRAGGV